MVVIFYFEKLRLLKTGEKDERMRVIEDFSSNDRFYWLFGKYFYFDEFGVAEYDEDRYEKENEDC
jgi:hypothetical protein